MAPSRERLVLRLNEVWHDLENHGYDGAHPEILEEEIPRWDRLAAELLGGPRVPFAVLDLGCGTGFVGARLAPRLRPDDRLACADLSAAMLEACRAALERAGLPCPATLHKLSGGPVELPDGAFDLVTANAVLHHVPDPAAFCREVSRLLRPGGAAVIAHEPSRAWYDRPALAWASRLALPFADWKLFGFQVLLATGLLEALRGPLGRVLPEVRRHNRLVAEANARLRAEGLIERDLGAAEISALLDVHSPTAGGTHRGRGFAPEDFAAWFPGWAVERLETYGHLGKLQARAGWTRALEGFLARRHPRHGSSLTVVLRKPA